MTMTGSMKLVLAAAGLALTVTGCGSGKIFSNKNAPDEFAIATKAPLVVPPDYALMPPRPGESRPQELTTSERAQQVLLGDVSAAPANTGRAASAQQGGRFHG